MGAGVGGVVVVIIFIVFVVIIIRRRRYRRNAITATPQPDSWSFGSFYSILSSSFVNAESSSTQPFVILASQLKLGAEIGRGEFGVIVKAIATGLPGCDTNTCVAVKIIRDVCFSFATDRC